jgi:hypothetical protein
VSNENPPDDDTTEDSGAGDANEAPAEREAARPKRSTRPAQSGQRTARGGQSARAAMPVGLLATIGLAAACLGAAGGWVGHDAQTKAKLRSESVPATSGSAAPSGPCGSWQQKICAGTGDTSAACAEAKAATDLLTPSTCEDALLAVPATLAKVKAERAVCDKLVGKLCADLPPGSTTCSMVRERTPSFPRERCEGMLSHYDEVIAELRQLDQQGGPQMGMTPPGSPGAAPGPGAHP